MGWNFVKRRMTKELGFNWIEKFDDFQKEPYAAASLGQVHKAKYKNKKLYVNFNTQICYQLWKQILVNLNFYFLFIKELTRQ